jgi:hypothetical protein
MLIKFAAIPPGIDYLHFPDKKYKKYVYAYALYPATAGSLTDTRKKCST